MVKCSCIIPVFNESDRIVAVLSCVTRMKMVSEIICVDDCSSDDSSQKIRKSFPEVVLAQHRKNQGKTAAILTGLKLSKSDNILLLDADDIDLNETELDNCIKIFKMDSLDCLLLTTKPMNTGYAIFRFLFPFCNWLTGNRIIKKEILLNLFKSNKFSGYQLEIAENKFLIENHKKVAHKGLSAIDIGKTSKNGLVLGIINEFRMWQEIFFYSGIFDFFKISLAISKNKI